MAVATTITLPQLAGALASLAKQIPFGPLLKAIRLDLIGETRSNFYDGHGPDGQAWPALAHPRVNSKGADKPLLDTGVLAASVTSAFSQGNVSEERADGFTWGSNLESAATHQFGATITPKNAKYLAIPATKDSKAKGSPRNWPKGELSFRFGKKGGVALDLAGVVQYYFSRSITVPARPFLGVNAEMEERYTEMTADYVADWAQQQVSAGLGGP